MCHRTKSNHNRPGEIISSIHNYNKKWRTTKKLSAIVLWEYKSVWNDIISFSHPLEPKQMWAKHQTFSDASARNLSFIFFELGMFFFEHGWHGLNWLFFLPSCYPYNPCNPCSFLTPTDTHLQGNRIPVCCKQGMPPHWWYNSNRCISKYSYYFLNTDDQELMDK